MQLPCQVSVICFLSYLIKYKFLNAVVTPLAGLIRWNVLAPLVSQKVSSSYSNLHLSLLQTLVQIVNTGPPTALNSQHLAAIASPLQAYAHRLKLEQKNPSEDPLYQKAMERFAQAIQVALTANCVYGNIPHLLCVLEALPSHTLMSIVIAANRRVV